MADDENAIDRFVVVSKASFFCGTRAAAAAGGGDDDDDDEEEKETRQSDDTRDFLFGLSLSSTLQTSAAFACPRLNMLSRLYACVCACVRDSCNI